MTFTQAFFAIQKRWAIVVIIVGLFAGCGMAYTAKLRPVYNSGARVLVSSSALSDLRVLSNPFISQVEPMIQQRIMSVHNEVGILACDELAREMGSRDTREVQWMMSSIRVSWLSDSSGLCVSVSHSDPKLASLIADAYANAIARYPDLKRRAVLSEWRTFITSRLQVARNDKPELEKISEQISEFEAIPPVSYSVSERAAVPTMPVYPNKTTNLLVSISVGLLMGLSTALLLETREIEKRQSSEDEHPR